MFSVSNRNHPPSSRLSRRELLRVGALGLSGLSLADLLRLEATAADSEHPTSATKAKRPKSVIYVVLNGGPSHIDMWDLKSQAPSEYRGPFSPIATKLPGVQICEHMPRQAAMMDRATLVRGIRSVENDHYLSEVYTGLPRSAGKRRVAQLDQSIKWDVPLLVGLGTSRASGEPILHRHCLSPSRQTVAHL